MPESLVWLPNSSDLLGLICLALSPAWGRESPEVGLGHAIGLVEKNWTESILFPLCICEVVGDRRLLWSSCGIVLVAAIPPTSLQFISGWLCIKELIRDKN